MNIYRVVKDRYLGYEVQKRRWWFPIWIQLDGVNTHYSLEQAKEHIIADKLKPTAVYIE